MGYDSFKNSVDQVKMYAQAAKNLAVAIFGYQTLHAATLTGKSSNRKKGPKTIESKLDATKLLCLKGTITFIIYVNSCATLICVFISDFYSETNTKRVAQIYYNITKIISLYKVI